MYVCMYVWKRERSDKGDESAASSSLPIYLPTYLILGAVPVVIQNDSLIHPVHTYHTYIQHMHNIHQDTIQRVCVPPRPTSLPPPQPNHSPAYYTTLPTFESHKVLEKPM